MRSNAIVALGVAGALLLARHEPAQAGPTEAEVGDADSFGRFVRYLGSAQTTPFELLADCDDAEAGSVCEELAAAPATTDFDEADLDTIQLPPNSTRTLLCFTLTPSVRFEFLNDTGVAQPIATFNDTAVVTLDSDVLDNPALINPLTAVPFGGIIEIPISTYVESRSLAVDERAFKRMYLSRGCVGGLISRQSLMQTYGLSLANTNAIFANQITLSFGLRGVAKLVSAAHITHGWRIYGD